MSGDRRRVEGLARRRVADAVGLPARAARRRRSVAVTPSGLDARQRARVDAVLLGAVHPHPDQLEVGPAGDRPDRQPPHPARRPPHHSVRHGSPSVACASAPRLGRKAQADVARSSCVGSRWPRRSASGAAARPSRRRTTPAAARRTSPGAVSASAPSAPAPTARDALQQLGGVHLAHRALDDRRHAGVLQREHALGLAQRARTSASTRSASATRSTAVVGARAVVEQRVAACGSPSPSHAAPLRSPSSAPVSWRQPWSTSPSTASAPTTAPSNRTVDSVQRLAVAMPVDLDARACSCRRGTSRGRGVPSTCGSVRAIVQHQSALCAPVTSTFSPSSTKPPARRACLRRDVRQVAPRTGLGVRDARVDGARARGGARPARAAAR